MLVWSKDETPEGAALQILNALFSTIQYSMVLATLPTSHRDVIRNWLGFSQRHRAALLMGAFRPHHAENGYSWIEGESDDERVIAVYADDVCANVGPADRQTFIANATGGVGVLVESAAAGRVEFFDVFGKSVGGAGLPAGISRLAIPASGYAKIVW